MWQCVSSHLLPDVIVTEEAAHFSFGQSASREWVIVSWQQVDTQNLNVTAVQCTAYTHTRTHFFLGNSVFDKRRAFKFGAYVAITLIFIINYKCPYFQDKNWNWPHTKSLNWHGVTFLGKLNYKTERGKDLRAIHSLSIHGIDHFDVNLKLV